MLSASDARKFCWREIDEETESTAGRWLEALARGAGKQMTPLDEIPQRRRWPCLRRGDGAV